MNTKIKRYFSVILMLICFMSALCTVYADDTSSTSDISVKLDNGSLTENVAVYFTEIESNQQYQLLLSKDNGYVGKIGLNTKNNYDITFSYKSVDIYDILNSNDSEINRYNPNLDGLNLDWVIKDKIVNTTDSTHGEDKQVDYSSASGKEVLIAYLSKVVLMEDNEKFIDFLSLYSGDMFKQYFLNADSFNTVEIWNKLSDFDRFNYYITFEYPQILITGVNSVTSKDAFISKLTSTKKLLNRIDSNDVIYGAIIEVWNWHWNNWTVNQKFINPYEGTELTQVNKISGSKKPSIADNKTEKAKKNVAEDLTNGNAFLNFFKDNIITLVILLIAGIAVLVIYLRNRKLNYDDDNV